MLIVNLFAGPGAGKSTLAASIFSLLKWRGVCAELVTEFAKDCAWEGRTGPLRCQPYMFGEQLWRLERLRDRGVEVAVTDSPILLNAIYASPGTPPAFVDAVRAYAKQEDALNVFIQRAKSYDARGRFQTESEAHCLDLSIAAACGPFHMTVIGSPDAATVIADAAQKRLAGPGDF